MEDNSHRIYINELLNGIGCDNQLDTIEKLIVFWTEYRKIYPYLDNIMLKDIEEYYVISDITIPYSEFINKFPITYSNDTLIDILHGIYSNKIEFLNSLSSYKILKSKLLETKYGYILDECINEVFTTLEQFLYSKNIELKYLLIQKDIYFDHCKPLSGYTIYNNNIKNKEVIIDELSKYKCENSKWSYINYSVNFKFKYTISYILKLMEYYVREYLGYRSLKFPEKDSILKEPYYTYKIKEVVNVIKKLYNINFDEIIKQTTINYLKNSNIPPMVFNKNKDEINEFDKEEKIDIVFDKEKFNKIREKSEEIQKALIVEETIEENHNLNEKLQQNTNKNEKIVAISEIPTKESADINNGDIFENFICNLTIPEKDIIKTIIQKQNVEMQIRQIAQQQNEMLEVIVSNINDKAIDTIGDTIIDLNTQSIYEDYENDIKQVL